MNRTCTALFLVFALLAASCVTVPVRVIEWPLPPDLARIRYVTYFMSSDELDVSTSAQVLRAIMGGGATERLGRPMGMALSSDGNRLFIADTGPPRLLVADFAAKSLKLFAPTDVVGSPFGVALDADDNVYVTDQANHRVVVLKPDGTLLRAFGREEGLVRPSGIAVDSHLKRVYVSDPARVDSEEHRVLTWDLEGHYIRSLGGLRGTEPGQFNFPLFLAVDGGGNLVVGDALNFRLQFFDPEGKFVRAYGQTGVGPGTFARMKGLAYDGFGTLYVVESEDAVVQLFNRDLEVLMVFGGNVNSIEFPTLPVPIAIDQKRNRIYVGNQVSPRVTVYDLVNTTADETMGGKKKGR